MRQAVRALFFGFAFVSLAACGAKTPPPVEPVPVASATPPTLPIAPPTAVVGQEPPRRSGFDCSLDDGSSLFGPRDPSIGSDDAPVVIVEFADFQCPFCSRAVDTLHDVLAGYGPEKVRLVFKQLPLPFHQNARPAAEASEAVMEVAGNEAFWRFHDRAFNEQQALTQDNFRRWARESGVVDLGAFDSVIMGGKAGQKVDGDLALSKKLGIQGTPNFLINGVALTGAQPADKFRATIDAELAKARAMPEVGARSSCAIAKKNVEAKAVAATTERKDDEDDNKIWRIPIGASPSIGPPSALVTIVEFADFQCPFCVRVDPTLAEVVKTYGSSVRVVWKDQPLPFHPRAEPAAQLAREAMAQRGVAGFWDAHDRIFASAGHLEDDDLLKIAADMKLNVPAVKSAIETHKHKRAIDADKTVATDFKANGTPHFFLNGRRLVGAQPIEKFKEVIDAEIARAKTLTGAGTPYDRAMKKAELPPGPETKKIAPAPAGAPSKGNAGAAVVIQEFSDFQCPFCSRAQAALKEVQDIYGARVRIVWRNKPLPMHKDAQLAAEAAMEAHAQKGSAGFWKMHDLLFENQSKDDGLGRAALEGYASQIGLDLGKFKDALDKRTHKAAIDAESKAADDAGISGTPGFSVNGYWISGAQSVDVFKRTIDRALADVASGKKK